MTESIITFPSKIGSNNPKAYGAINATQVSGHKQVATTSDLYTIPDSILSESKDNTNNDAIEMVCVEFIELLSINQLGKQ